MHREVPVLSNVEEHLSIVWVQTFIRQGGRYEETYPENVRKIIEPS